MTILMKMQWAGVTADQYDAAERAVRWREDPAVGGLLHVAWIDDQGLQVRDAWETPEHFQTFVEERLTPGVADLGLPGEPVVEIFPMHYMQQTAVDPGADACIIEGTMPNVEVFDALATKVGWAGVEPEGGICFMGGVDRDGGLYTVSAWRSVADSDAFRDDRLLPGLAALGATDDTIEAPNPQPLHAVWRP